MSKGLGQKIAIQFSEKITSFSTERPKYRFYRWNFLNLVGTRIGFNEVAIKTEEVDYHTPIATPSASSSFNSNYYPISGMDGNTNTVWQTADYVSNAWFKLEFQESITITGFRFYLNNGSHRPGNFEFQASIDGINWETIHIGSIYLSTGYNYFEDIAKIPLYDAFHVSGSEYKYVNGPLINKRYEVVNLEIHPDISGEKHLLLTTPLDNRFNNVEGPLTVQYDQIQGSLMGRGGPVEGFTETFIPTDLEPKPNPGIADNIEISAEASVTFTKVTYNQRYADEQITVSATATVDFIYVGVINP